jgi:hypothetical protein
MLTQKALLASGNEPEVLSLLALLVLYWCFTGTKVQLLMQKTHLAHGGDCNGNGCHFVKC